MTGSLLAEFAVAAVVALLWPVAAVVAAVRALRRPRASAALAADAQIAGDRTLAAGVAAVVAAIFGLVLFMSAAMRKGGSSVEFLVIAFLVANAVGLALAALPLAAVAARGRELGARVWIGLLLACGVLALVWGPLYTNLDGGIDFTLAPGPASFAAGWPIAALVGHVALSRRGAGADEAGARLAWASSGLALAAVVVAAAIFWGVLDHGLGPRLFPHHVGLTVAASIAGLGALTRGDGPAHGWVGLAIVEALLLGEAIHVGAAVGL